MTNTAGSSSFASFLCATLVLACSREQPAQPPEAPRVPAADGWQDTVFERIRNADYVLRAESSALHATNHAQGLVARWNASGVSFGDRETRAVRLSLDAWGRDTLADLPRASFGLGACRKDAAVDPEGRCLRRAESRRGPVLEWWENRADGLEQGFTVQQRPEGGTDAGLRLRVAVHGASVELEADGRAARLRPASGPVLRYAGLKAWDALGRDLDARLVADARGFVVVVNDRDASYPVQIDPLVTSSTWQVTGSQYQGNLGWAVGPAGDVNGDGFADAFVSSPYYDSSSYNSGVVYIFHGGPSGFATVASSTIDGPNNWEFGRAVTAGDFNGDGFDDLAVGSPNATLSQYFDGAVNIYVGSQAGLNTSLQWRISAYWYMDRFGSHLAAADFNGDGFEDLVVGAPYHTDNESYEGRLYLYLGSASGPAQQPSWTFEPNEGNAMLGPVAAAGDVNGDGYADLIAAAPQHGNAGRAWVFFGGATGFPAQPSWTMTSDRQGGQFGCAVSSAGDVNGDGFADVLVGASNVGNGYPEGSAFLYPGSPSGPSQSASWSASGQSGGGQFGWSVASAGDVNGDGYSDVVVGAPKVSSVYSEYGTASVFFGSAGGLSASPDWTSTAMSTGANLGFSVAGVGDVNGDGLSDVLVGSPMRTYQQYQEGSAQLVNGSASGPALSAGWAAPQPSADAQLGASIAAAGDVNGDGFGDVVVGAPGIDGGRGAAFVYLGTSAGLTSSATRRLDGTLGGSSFGAVVASAGDVNGDGYGDVVVGAPGLTDGQAGEGAAYVFHGGAGAFAGTAARVLQSNVAGARFGAALTAGDVNGDGFWDLVSAAPGVGRIYAYMGSVEGLAAAPVRIDGSAAEQFGAAIAAGDINGDGYADVVVGAPAYSETAQDEGRLLLYVGAPAGLSTTSSSTFAPGQPDTRVGALLAVLGDMQGDGYADVLVGTPDGESVARLVSGTALGFASWPEWTDYRRSEDVRHGSSVGAAGDVDGDGFADRIVGAPGAVMVYSASNALLWELDPNGAGSLGASVASAGDVNGDGYADLLLGGTGSGDGARLFLGNGADGKGPGRPLLVQARRVGTTTPIAPGGLTGHPTSFDLVAPHALGPAGRGRVKLQAEVQPLNVPFSGGHNGGRLVTSPAWVDTGVNGAPVKVTVDGLRGEQAYHWRARLVFPKGGTTRWIYGGTNGQPSRAHVRTPCADLDHDGVCESLDPDDDGDGDPDTTDCDDENPAVKTGATETCNEVDDDCDGTVDDGVQTTFYADADRDTFGAPGSQVLACQPSEGVVTNGGDCDDQNPRIHPGAAEVAFDRVDQDCDGKDTCFSDADKDTFGGSTALVPTDDDDCEDEGESTNWRDCDDTKADVRPGAPEVCNGLDDDCDLYADEFVQTRFFEDADGDGHGDFRAETLACTLPAGHVELDDDCDDADGSRHPGAAEVAGDGLDQDCDGHDAPAAPAVPEGCGCATSRSPASVLLLLVAVALRRRRRA